MTVNVCFKVQIMINWGKNKNEQKLWQCIESPLHLMFKWSCLLKSLHSGSVRKALWGCPPPGLLITLSQNITPSFCMDAACSGWMSVDQSAGMRTNPPTVWVRMTAHAQGARSITASRHAFLVSGWLFRNEIAARSLWAQICSAWLRSAEPHSSDNCSHEPNDKKSP